MKSDSEKDELTGEEEKKIGKNKNIRENEENA